ncbi:peroxisomal membrane anchor protein Pex14, putative [Cordyceps militaris CM01]|uniref:Peroxisomal membrane protein PEX14 n=1 Tax=Cordyceps militaris (strain CM01) TaxID=983644 RepID=G3J3B9_CORMM|nr:peroxisomal membrane anchor protein Pex14, putative [Cordyceps militaris CM01]EGX95649.1 peroxisomal membrane anchor protein Pex14, putative [Cordyceps militaris CM01]
MAIREDLVASAPLHAPALADPVAVLQDPNVASSSVENRVGFLRSKNLTAEEIDHALARTGAGPSPGVPGPYPPQGSPQPYYSPYQQQAWQPQPPPRRDWRDWFIMATLVGSVSYGVYTLGKRYVYPLIAPPTPEKLEQDKKSIEDQFERAFVLVEQLAKDTEELKQTEKLRTEKLDAALAELETVMSDLKTANRRRDDDAQRIREDIQGLKDAIPKAMESQKTQADNRLYEINTELTSLKTLVSQRMTAGSSSASGYSRPGASSTPAAAVPVPAVAATPKPATVSDPAATSTESGSTEKAAEPVKAAESSRTPSQTPFNKGSGKASIPAWQMAMANKNVAGSSTAASGSNTGEGASSSS